ncbi:MAG: hypothetical protein H6839_05150 [Planctomycetes bacterium]|nr:hypothetical protein [Planctomycetota bacterium]
MHLSRWRSFALMAASLLGALSVLVVISLLSQPTAPHSVPAGVILADDSDELEIKDFAMHEAFQETQVWCWAACVEMTVNGLKGKRITTQSEVVTRAFGSPVVTRAPSVDFLLTSMKEVWIPNPDGFDYRIDGTVLSEADMIAKGPGAFAKTLKTELKDSHPIILAVNDQSHVIVCYGAKLGKQNGVATVESLKVMDPWPGNGDEELVPDLDQWNRPRLDAKGRARWKSKAPVANGQTAYYTISHAITSKLETTKTVSHPKAVAARLSWETWGYEADQMGNISVFAYYTPVEGQEPKRIRAKLSWKYVAQMNAPPMWMPPQDNYFLATLKKPANGVPWIASFPAAKPSNTFGMPIPVWGLQVFWVLEY